MGVSVGCTMESDLLEAVRLAGCRVWGGGTRLEAMLASGRVRGAPGGEPGTPMDEEYVALRRCFSMRFWLSIWSICVRVAVRGS